MTVRRILEIREDLRMSWNQIYIEDINLSLSPTYHDLSMLSVTWTCPRCGKEQTTDIDPHDLIYSLDIECLNVNVCGKRQSYFELSLNLLGSYKGLLDRPLNKEKEKI
jgi:hypothetical protein